MNQTLQDILNTIQWEDYDVKLSNDIETDSNSSNSSQLSQLEDELDLDLNEEDLNRTTIHQDEKLDLNFTNKSTNDRQSSKSKRFIQSKQSKRKTRDESGEYLSRESKRSNTIGDSARLITTSRTYVSLPSTAYSTYSYFNDLDSEYERAIHEFDEFGGDSRSMDDSINSQNENSSDDDTINLESEYLENVNLTEEQYYHLHLDDGEIDNFQQSVQNIKNEMENIDFTKKAIEVEELKKELLESTNDPLIEEWNQLENSIINKSQPSIDGDNSFVNQENAPSKSNDPHLNEEQILKLKEDHYNTIRYQMEDDENPVEELLKSVDSIQLILKDDITSKSLPEISIQKKDITKINTDILHNSMQKSTLLSDLKRKHQEQKETLRKKKQEHKAQLIKLRKEREMHEKKAKEEELERQKREQEREELFRKEIEENRRQIAIWNMQREEQFMRDYMFELEQIRLEELKIAKELEEKRKKEWEMEQERLKQEEIRKAEERRKRLEQEKLEREKIAKEKFEREQELERMRLLEEKKRIKRLEKQKLEQQRKLILNQQKQFLEKIKKEKNEKRDKLLLFIKSLKSNILKGSIIKKSVSPKNTVNTFSSLLQQWKTNHKELKYSKMTIKLTTTSTPEINEEGDIILDDNLIEILSGDLSQLEEHSDVSDSIINLILSVEKISSIGEIKSQIYQNILSLILDENSIQTLKKIDQFSKLLHLSVKLNNLKVLEGISNLKELIELNVETNQLETFYGIGIGNGLNIRYIDASHNRLKSFDHVTHCKNISVLKLYRNQLESLNPITYLEKLLELDAGRNKLTNLHESTFQFSPLLQKLVLYENSLEEMPNTSRNILLKQLFLNGNSLKDANKFIMFHPMLEYLNLSDNQIEKLPQFQYFFMLKNVNISFNSIISLEEICQAFRNSSIETLKSNDNPVCSINGYREVLISIMPNLQTLDDEPVTLQERNDIEFFCTIKSKEKLKQLWEYLDFMKYSNPFELMRILINNGSTNWLPILRSANAMHEEVEEKALAYKRLCQEQSNEYVAFNTYYKRKLYIPLNKKTDQSKHAETLKWMSNYYERWNNISQNHHNAHISFENKSSVIVYNPKYFQEKAALTIQKAYREYKLKNKVIAAIKIQAFIRGSLCRIKTIPWMIKELRTRHRAAIKIQKLWRGFRVRNILWKAKHAHSWIDESIGDLEQINLDEFNYDPNLLGNYELKVDIPSERKVSQIPVLVQESKNYQSNGNNLTDKQMYSIKLQNQFGNQTHQSNSTHIGLQRKNSLLILDENRASPDFISTSSSEDGQTSSVYNQKFHSSLMKQRVNTLSKISATTSQSKIHTMDQLGGSNGLENKFKTSQIRNGENWNTSSSSIISNQTTNDYSHSIIQDNYTPTRNLSNSMNLSNETYNRTSQFENTYSDEEVDENPQLIDSSKKKHKSVLDKEKEEWNFKSDKTAQAYTKWALKRKKLKNADKKKKSDPIERLKKIQKKTQSASITVNKSQDQLFSRRNDTSTRSSLNQGQDIEVESVSSNDYHEPRVPIQSRLLNFQNTTRR